VAVDGKHGAQPADTDARLSNWCGRPDWDSGKAVRPRDFKPFSLSYMMLKYLTIFNSAAFLCKKMCKD
jgi:hypothetical protein